MSEISTILKDEYKSWEQSHAVIFDDEHRKASLEILNLIKDETPLCIANSKNSSISGLVYEHWFIMINRNATYFIEFNSFDLNYENYRVNINLAPRSNITILKEFSLTKSVRQRIDHVLGMKNYSLCLRNSQHVANYIYDGKWYSSQVELFYLEMCLNTRWEKRRG